MADDYLTNLYEQGPSPQNERELPRHSPGSFDVQPYAEQQIMEQQRIESANSNNELNAYGIGNMIAEKRRQNWPIYTALMNTLFEENGPDPGWQPPIQWSEAITKRIMEEAPEAEWDNIFESLSVYDVNQKLDAINKKDEFEKLWAYYSDHPNEHFLEGLNKFVQNYVEPLTDPALLPAYIVGGAGASMATGRLVAASRLASIRDGYTAINKTSKVMASMGIHGTVDMGIAGMHSWLLRQQDPLFDSQDAIDYILVAGVTGAAFGGVEGAFRLGKAQKAINDMVLMRQQRTHAVLESLGADGAHILNKLIKSNTSQRKAMLAELEERVAKYEELEAAFTAGGGEGPSSMMGPLPDRPTLEKILIAARENDRLLTLEAEIRRALLTGRTSRIIALVDSDLKLIKQRGLLGDTDIVELLRTGQLGTSDTVQANILNKIFDGKTALITHEELKWMMHKRPDILDKLDIHHVMGRVVDRRNRVFKFMQDNAKEITKRADAMRLAKKKVGEVVYTADGRVGKVISISDDGTKITVQGARSVELEEGIKQVKARKAKLAKQLEESKKRGPGGKFRSQKPQPSRTPGEMAAKTRKAKKAWEKADVDGSLGLLEHVEVLKAEAAWRRARAEELRTQFESMGKSKEYIEDALSKNKVSEADIKEAFDAYGYAYEPPIKAPAGKGKIGKFIEESDKTKNLRQQVKRLEKEAEDLQKALDDPIVADEVFIADASHAARWNLADEYPKPVQLKPTPGKRATSGSRKIISGYSGTVYGQDVNVTRYPLEVALATHQWKVTIGKIIWEPEARWEYLLKKGKFRRSDPAYINRVNLTGKTKQEVFDEIENFVRNDKLKKYETTVQDGIRSKHLDLFPEDAPRDLVSLLAKGTIPKELREVFGDLDMDILQEYAKDMSKPRHMRKNINDNASDMLTSGAEVTSSGVIDIKQASAGTISKTWKWLQSFWNGFGPRMTSHHIPLIAKISQDVFGSWVAPVTQIGGHTVAGGAAGSLMAGGMLWQRRVQHMTLMARYAEAAEHQLGVYRAARRGTGFNSRTITNQFSDEIRRYVEFDELPKVGAAPVKKVGDAFRETTKSALDFAKKNGVEELMDVVWSKNYFPRLPSVGKIDSWLANIADINLSGGKKSTAYDQMRQLFKKGLMSADNELPEVAAEAVARRLTSYYINPKHAGRMTDGVLGIQAREVNDFIKKLDQECIKSGTGPLEDAAKEALVKFLGERGKVSRSLFRIRLDHKASMKFKLKNGSTKTLSLYELFQNDPSKVLGKYTVDLVTESQKKALLKRYTTATYKPKSIEELFQDIKERLRHTGHAADEQLFKDLDMMENYIMNRPRFTRTPLGNLMATVGQLGVVLKLPQFVKAAVPETMMAGMSAGVFQALTENIPIFGKHIRDMRGGRASKEMVENFVNFEIGMGSTEFRLSELYEHMGHVSEGDSLMGQGFMGRMYGGLSRTTQKVSKWSGFRYMQQYSDTVATRNFFDIITRASVGNKKSLSQLSDVRIAQLGWTRKDVDDIIKELQRPGIVNKEPVGKGSFYSINFEEMDDIIRAKFNSGAANNIRQTVQRSASWDLPYILLSTEVGELLTQFRAFGMTSQANHFARNLQAHDAMAFTQVSTMLFGGSLVHMYKAYARYGDDPEKLNEELSIHNIILGGMLYSGFMGMMPDLIDAILYYGFGQKTMFAQDEPLLLRVPFIDTARGMYGGLQAGVSSAWNGELTRDDYGKIFRSIPMHNFAPIEAINDFLIQPLVPEQ